MKLTQKEVGAAKLGVNRHNMAHSLSKIAEMIHQLNDQWWRDPKTGRRIKRNKGEMIALIHSELSEALEGVRKSAKDGHLPQYSSEAVEMADAVIRILDYCWGHGIPIGPAIMDKLRYNYERSDHKPENRIKKHGKKF